MKMRCLDMMMSPRRVKMKKEREKQEKRDRFAKIESRRERLRGKKGENLGKRISSLFEFKLPSSKCISEK